MRRCRGYLRAVNLTVSARGVAVKGFWLALILILTSMNTGGGDGGVTQKAASVDQRTEARGRGGGRGSLWQICARGRAEGLAGRNRVGLRT